MPDVTVDDPVPPGRVVVRADVVGTVVFVAASALASVSSTLAGAVLVPVCAITAVMGLVGFVWSYAIAIGRSRESEIAVSQLYAVAGTVAPPAVKRTLQRCLWTQVAVAVAVMAIGFSRTHPNQFNWSACAVVVPMFGMGLNGWWVARHGTFGARILVPRPSRRAKNSESRTSGPPMGQNADHG